MLPQNLQQAIETHFQSAPQQTRAVGGGDINESAQVQLENGQTIFAKWHHQPPTNMFKTEAYGLQLLTAAGGLRIPQVYFCHEKYLVMEWLGRGNRADKDIAAALGEGLAQQHRTTAETYGLDCNNYCGLTPQQNTPTGNWVTFFGEHRLGYQMELAAQKGYMPQQRRKKLEQLITRLPHLLPATPPASLLHGDLWGGNWLVTASNKPALIDPAVYYGHREADLAFTGLFGGFPPTFYDAYNAAWPLKPGYQERKHIYNLYHLLNHLNLFGEGYGRQVEATLNQYI